MPPTRIPELQWMRLQPLDQPLALPHGTSDCLFLNGATVL